MQPSSDITLVDDPYTTFLITEATLDLAPPLASLPAATKTHLARYADDVVESVLGLPFDMAGRRSIARARWREKFYCLQDDYKTLRLGRPPVAIITATLDAAPIDLDELIVLGATGLLRLAAGCWPRGSALEVEYWGGWRTPGQETDGAPADFGPALPPAIITAAIRAASLAASSLVRDPGARTVRDADSDAGEHEITFAAPPTESGQDADIFRLLAPWRRLALM